MSKALSLGKFHWLVGLVEGEGSFFESPSGGPQFGLSMTDQDVMLMASEMIGGKVRGPYRNGQEANKQRYMLTLYGAEASKWMRLLAPHLGERRRQKVASIFPSWDVSASEQGHKRSLENITWLAGIVEGEGSISADTRGGKGAFSLQLQVAMTDRDVMERVGLIFSSAVTEYQPRGYKRDGSPYRLVYTVSLSGSVAAGWLMTMYKFFGLRRREKTRELLSEWMSRDIYRGDREKCPRGHQLDGRNERQRYCKTCERTRVADKRMTIHNTDEHRSHDAALARKRRLRRRIEAAVSGVLAGASLLKGQTAHALELGQPNCGRIARVSDTP